MLWRPPLFTNFRQLESKMGYLRRSTWAIAAVAAATCLAVPAHAQKTLRVVMHSDLKILDPIWTTAYIVRNHGYMIYDTLFSQDEKGEVKPQMVDKYDVSADGLTYTLTLRDGLGGPSSRSAGTLSGARVTSVKAVNSQRPDV